MKFIAPSWKIVMLYAALSVLTFAVAMLIASKYDYIQEQKLEAWLSYVGAPWEVTNQPRPGDAIVFEVSRCNNSGRGRSYAVSRFMINTRSGRRTILPASLVSIISGCSKEINAINIVPMGTTPGTYFLEGYAEVDNGHVPVTVYWSTQPFDVAAP